MQIRRQTEEIIVSLIFVAVGLIGMFRALTYVDPMQGEYPTLTSTFTPVLWSSLMTVLGVIYLLTMTVRRVKSSGAQPEEEAVLPEAAVPEAGVAPPGAAPAAESGAVAVSPRRIAATALGTAIALIAYCFLLRKVNFLFITIVLLFTLVSIYQGLHRWWKSAIVATVSGAAVYAVFVVFMRIPL